MTLLFEQLLVPVPLIRGSLHVLVILLLEEKVSVGNRWFVPVKEGLQRTGSDHILVVPVWILRNLWLLERHWMDRRGASWIIAGRRLVLDLGHGRRGTPEILLVTMLRMVHHVVWLWCIHLGRAMVWHIRHT